MAEPLSASSDLDLVARIQGGDEAAFALVFLQHYQRLCVLAARMMRSDAAAEELVQDVFFRVWQQRERWDVTSTIGGYLTMSVRNHALNQLRRNQIVQTWSAQESGSTRSALHGQLSAPDEELGSNELADAIARAIDDLPSRCREAYVLRRQHQLSCAEIARIMQISPKTVEIQIGNALKMLRKRLAEWL